MSTSAKTPWFDVDKAGFAKLMSGRNKSFVLYELLQNCWDAVDCSRVEVVIAHLPDRPLVRVVVEDDSPDGFSDLADAYTLFAESRKKAEPTKRGRYDLGEKLVLAMADNAEITTTTGSVCFGPDGRTIRRHRDRKAGSCFRADFSMTREDMDEMIAAARRVIPPIPTFVNNVPLTQRQPVATFQATLPTVKADEHGVLRPTKRPTELRVYRSLDGAGTIFEMGLPVVDTGDSFDVEVMQKVPLTIDRENVTPSFLRALRVEVLNHTYHLLTNSQVNDPWVRQACGDDRATNTAVGTIVTKRFGQRAVAYDPSDPEANKLAIVDDRPLVYGGHLSAQEWANVRRAGVLLPAGKVTPSQKPCAPETPSHQIIPSDQWTAGMKQVAAHAQKMGLSLLGAEITVTIVHSPDWNVEATYGRCILTLNVGTLGHKFFDRGIGVAVNDLLIHEFGHHYSSDHLSSAYYDALTDLGARTVQLALDQPALFG